jgi:hypothetical protein
MGLVRGERIIGRVGEERSEWEAAVFSKEFANALNQATSAMQQDQAVRQLPAVQHLTDVLRTLWREVERLERQVAVSSNEIIIKTGGASIVLKADGSISIKGRDITIEASGNVALKAGGNLALKGSRVVQD